MCSVACCSRITLRRIELAMGIEQDLREFAYELRRMMEPGLLKTDAGQVISAGSCLHMSVMAQIFMRKYKICESVIRGGSGEDGQGCQATDGSWHGHYWLECFRQGGITDPRFVVDLTADQFGWEAVRIIPLAEAQGYCPGSQPEVDAEVATLTSELMAQQ